MDLKKAGNLLLIWSGTTRDELGGSHWAEARGFEGGVGSPGSIPVRPRRIFRAVHRAITAGLVRSCHDLSEGGLAVALAEMAIAGGLGVEVLFAQDPLPLHPAALLVLRVAHPVPPGSPPTMASKAVFEICSDRLAIEPVGAVDESPNPAPDHPRRDQSAPLIDAPLSP